MELVRFIGFVVKLAIALAMIGELKTCTFELMGKAASHREIISYSKFARALRRH